MRVLFFLLFISTAALGQSTWRNAPWPDATVVALDGQEFTVPANTQVWWGNGTRWVTGKVSGVGWCDKRTFRFNFDAAVAKKCVVEYPPPWISPGGIVIPKHTNIQGRCAPAPKGNGTLPVIDANTEGVTFAYWCPGTEANPPVLTLFAVQWWAFDVNLVAKVVSVAFSSDAPAAIKALSIERASVPLEQLYSVWGPSEKRILAARPEK